MATNNTNKTKNLLCGLGFLLLGAIMIFLGLRSDISIVSSMGCGFVGSGLGLIWQFWYWSRPGRDYAAHLEQAKISSRDEMLVMLRQRAGWLTYGLTLVMLLGLALFFAFCVSLDWLLPFARYGLYMAAAMLVFEWLCGIIVFKWLKQRF